MMTIVRPLILGFAIASACSTVLAGAYDDLISAAYQDDTTTVLSLINRGMDANSVDPAGNSLLHVAARNGNDNLVSGLIKLKANPNARNRSGDTPLMLAVYSGKEAAAKALLAGGAQINQDGWAPLHYAVYAEQTEMVSLLLSKGAKVDARAPNQQTPLMLAAKNGNIEIARTLLNAKADPSLKDQHGETALSLANQNNNTDIARLIQQPSAPVKVAPVAVKPAPAAAKPAASVPAKKAPVEDNSGEYVSPPFQTEK